MREMTSFTDNRQGPFSNRSRFLLIGIALMGLLFGYDIHAQLPVDLPWPGSLVNGRTVMVQPGIAAVSCGTTEDVSVPERFSFALMNVDGVIPGSGRVDASGSAQKYEHPSWLVNEIGNIFGVAINERTGDMFLSASSNYAAGFFGAEAVLRYGDLGGGADSLAAAGTVYQVDGATGQASIFAVLPQQSATFTHIDCEGSDSVTRTTGVGLGNIHYDRFHDQYFVTNIEDGRIYRLDALGNILDSYDPSVYDDGALGISSLTDLVYGVAVEPSGKRLFFGGVSTTGQVPLWSIDLAAGGFVGTIDNTNLPAGATWNNYVGSEVLHTNVSAETGVPTVSVYHLADLEFTPDSRLLAGIRVGCKSWFTSYNHQGESDVITPNGGGIYNLSIDEFDVSVANLAAEDAYGGVSFYEHADGSVDFVTSSSDILNEVGPHGIAVFPSADATLSPIDPLAAISYGVVDSGDPKGVGGSVDVFSSSPPPCLKIIDPKVLCEEDGSFTFTFRFRNLRPEAIEHVFALEPPQGVTLTPSYFNLSSDPVETDTLSPPLTIKVQGASPGETLNFLLTIHDAAIAQCCSFKVTVELPTCDCAQVLSESLACKRLTLPWQTASVDFTFELENLSNQQVEHLLLVPSKPKTFQIQPNHVPTGLGQLDSTGSIPITFSGPGSSSSEFCFLASLHTATFNQCCAVEHCVEPRFCFDPRPTGNPLEPIDATYTFYGRELHVEPRSGADRYGVSLPFLGGFGCDIHWENLDVRDELPVGTILTVETTEASGRNILESWITFRESGKYVLTADASAVSEGGVQAEVYRHGELVATAVAGDGGDLLTFPRWPSSAGAALRDGQGYTIWGHEDLVIKLPSGDSVIGDAAVVGPRGATGVHTLGAVRVLASASVPRIVITDLAVAFDCNENGVPDATDIATGASLDVNANGQPDECEPDAFDLVAVLNTGFDQTTGELLPVGELPAGTADDDWRVVGGAATGPAKVVIEPNSAWPPAFTDSRWISTNPQGQSPGSDAIRYRYCFCLSGEAKTAEIDLIVFADDRATVLLNGRALAGPGGSFQDADPLAISYSERVGFGLLAPGQNCLAVSVADPGRVATGFVVNGEVRAPNGVCR